MKVNLEGGRVENRGLSVNNRNINYKGCLWAWGLQIIIMSDEEFELEK